MRIMYASLLGFVLATLTGCRTHRVQPGNKEAQAASGVAEVQRVQLETAWIGLGVPASAMVSLQREGDRFRGTWVHSTGSRMESAPALNNQGAATWSATPAAVAALLRALAQPCIAKPTLATFGITAESLRSHASKGFFSALQRYEKLSRPAFEREFADPERAQANLERLFQNPHTDDYPTATVKLTLTDGHVWKAETESQFAMMLPWNTTSPDGKTCATYAPAVPGAVLPLLPPGTVNGERLSDDSLYDRLTSQAAFQATFQATQTH